MNNEAHLTVEAGIRSRRTIKKFKTEPISLEMIKELLDIAIWAPNHKLREPWRFIAFLDEGKQLLVDGLRKEKEKGKFPRPMKPERVEHLLSIPAFVVVVMQVDPRPMIFEEDFAAVSACIQNFQLAAWERGIGMLWSTDQAMYSPTFHTQIGVKPGEKIVGIMQMGYPDLIPQARPRTSIEEKLTVMTSASPLEEN
ncbi:nitroreductase [Cytobacillus eiseniae]|uniref:Putative NAD(P)H nitroreductase n=1 Tax=Cytobacillus eiseniae TaxID=762947 RepID=A0ABS4RJ44_9BACI|nr:nitroreductase [Cytobacillus eiseniae]MBP2242930.1 nitroreductase [Cytobacillus eiseniae]